MESLNHDNPEVLLNEEPSQLESLQQANDEETFLKSLKLETKVDNGVKMTTIFDAMVEKQTILPKSRRSLSFYLAGTTNGGSEHRQTQNQDAYFYTQYESNLVLGMFDGHGKEYGQMASNVVKDYFQVKFKSNIFPELKKSPETVLRHMFKEAHELLKQKLFTCSENAGYEMKLEQGRLPHETFYSRRRPGMPFQCLHGGTTVTLVIILEGKQMIVANVGDSAALLCGAPIAISSLKPLCEFGPSYKISEEMIAQQNNVAIDKSPKAKQVTLSRTRHETAMRRNDMAVRTSVKEESPEKTNGEKNGSSGNDNNEEMNQEMEEVTTTYHPIVLTADHSPESIYEYQRVTELFGDHPKMPLLFLYDVPTAIKRDRPSIFEYNAEQSLYHMQNKGRYYKNVRSEWASLVATPQDAMYQDALAFTRSLGDFHIHTYGVSYEPDIIQMNLEDLFRGRREEEIVGEKRRRSLETKNVCALVVATDGVWDCWKYDQVEEYILAKQRIDMLKEETNNVQYEKIKVTMDDKSMKETVEEFMKVNLSKAKSLFGDSADNMTAIICYLMEE